MDGLRNRAIFELIYSTGMRAQEALGLDVADVHLDGMWVSVKGKGGKERVLPFGEKAHARCRSICGRSGRGGRRREQALFVNRQGERLSTGAC